MPNALAVICLQLSVWMCVCVCARGMRLIHERTCANDTDKTLWISVSTFQTRYFIVVSLPAGSNSSVVIQCNHQNNYITLFKSPFSSKSNQATAPKIAPHTNAPIRQVRVSSSLCKNRWSFCSLINPQQRLARSTVLTLLPGKATFSTIYCRNLAATPVRLV